MSGDFMRNFVVGLMVLGSSAAFASDWTSSVDSAESGLRVLLNRPARGELPAGR
jgi:hypothetical protein